MSRRVEWPTAGITSPGVWVSADRLSWQRMPDGLDKAARAAWTADPRWRVLVRVAAPKDAADAMREGMRDALRGPQRTTGREVPRG